MVAKYEIGKAGLARARMARLDLAAKGNRLVELVQSLCVFKHTINIRWPAENKQLFDKILENGAWVTQFPFNRPGDKQSFPIRHRIVAGMTLGTVVVEAT